MATENGSSAPASQGNNTTIIVVIVVVMLVVILILVGCIIWLCLRRKGLSLSSFLKQGRQPTHKTEDETFPSNSQPRNVKDTVSVNGSCPSISLEVAPQINPNPRVTSYCDDDQSRGSMNHTPSVDSGFQSYSELSARELTRGVYPTAKKATSIESVEDEFDQVEYRPAIRKSRHVPDSEHIIPVIATVEKSAPPTHINRNLQYPERTRFPEKRSTYHEDMDKGGFEIMARNSSNSLPNDSKSAKRYLQSKALSTDSGIGSSNVSLRNSAMSLEKDTFSCRTSTLSTDSVFEDCVDGSNPSLAMKFQSADILLEAKDLGRFRSSNRRPVLQSTGSVIIEPPTDKEMMVRILTKQFERIVETQSDQWRETIYVTPNFAIGIFDNHGGHLTLPDKSVDLYIPPGALSRRQVVYICRCVEDQDNDDVIFYSPVVDCGPDGLKFNVPVILNIKHCASATGNHQPQLVLARKGSADDTWDSGIEEDAFVTVQKQTCSMFIDHFTKYGLGVVCKECSGKGIVRERLGNNSFDSGYMSPSVSKGDIANGDGHGCIPQKNNVKGADGGIETVRQDATNGNGVLHRPALASQVPDKLLYLCCYLQYQGADMSMMRIYFLNKEDGMLNSLEARESMCDGKLGSPPQEFLFRPTDDLHVRVKSCVGCELMENGQDKVIDIGDVLNKSYGYVNFPLKITTKDTNAFCNVEVFQPSRCKSRVPFTAIVNNWDKRSLEVDDLLKRFTELLNPRSFQHDQVLGFLQDTNLLPAVKHRAVIPRDLRARLSLWLDTTNSTACDWRGLAEVLGMDPEAITWMDNNHAIISKTDMTLSYYENKCQFEKRSPADVFSDLAVALHKIGHSHGYQLVKRYIDEHGMNDLPHGDVMRSQNSPQDVGLSGAVSRDSRISHNQNKSRNFPSAIPEESETDSVSLDAELPTIVQKPSVRDRQVTRRQESGYGSMSDNGYVLSLVDNGNNEKTLTNDNSPEQIKEDNAEATMV